MAPRHPAMLYGLIGHPLMHSYSMDYFNQKFDTEDISAEYINFDLDDINQLMEVVSERPNLNGLNVTTPYKEAVIPFLASLDEHAQAIGAVNVIKFLRDKKTGELEHLRGYNSDAPAFEQTMRPLMTPSLDRALVLGTGGAAKAVTYALHNLGVEVQQVSRYRFIGSGHLCYDLIYNPDETMFMKQCKKRGATVKNGLEMLLLQAFLSYEIWNAD